MITPIDQSLAEELQHKIDFKTKPTGALGQLEKVALQIGLIQNTLSPNIEEPHLIVFAGDHGLAKEGVSAYPQEVTHQMVLNFLGGGAAINVFCRQHGIELKVVDAGVNHDFGAIPGLIDAKLGYGTNSTLAGQAMSVDKAKEAIQRGKEIVKKQVDPDCSLIGFGEMGIGNTSSSALIMHYITKLDVPTCVGKGTGVNKEQLAKKIEILEAVVAKHGHLEDPYKILAGVGGFEIGQMAGAFLEAASQKIAVVVDGFIATAAYAIATLIDENVKGYALFAHQSDEKGHLDFVKFLGGEPMLNLGLRLGEGTGVALAFPLIRSAVNFLNEMASFEDANVSNK
ncbi:MAG: nicotinate-nucleotide--dimethylbenzimidazole phosphoribosyltransferase [Crocinitomicaceae bacterium]|nr:nicotinate-nucleotide--dimethylbenzimidazole phosphoribosyltransferase [Crocinitomicaceae bacterium]